MNITSSTLGISYVFAYPLGSLLFHTFVISHKSTENSRFTRRVRVASILTLTPMFLINFEYYYIVILLYNISSGEEFSSFNDNVQDSFYTFREYFITNIGLKINIDVTY